MPSNRKGSTFERGRWRAALPVLLALANTGDAPAIGDKDQDVCFTEQLPLSNHRSWHLISHVMSDPLEEEVHLAFATHETGVHFQAPPAPVRLLGQPGWMARPWAKGTVASKQVGSAPKQNASPCHIDISRLKTPIHKTREKFEFAAWHRRGERHAKLQSGVLVHANKATVLAPQNFAPVSALGSGVNAASWLLLVA